MSMSRAGMVAIKGEKEELLKRRRWNPGAEKNGIVTNDMVEATFGAS